MIVGCFVFASSFCSTSAAQQWPAFRGPSGSGVLETIEHPLEWSEDKNVAWSVEVPGGGWSSPVVAGDKIFLTTAIGKEKPVGFSDGVRNMRGTKPDKPLKFQLICLKLSDGTKVWDKTVVERMPEHTIHPSNTYATESPTTDGKNVFVYFAAIGVVACYDLDGNENWQVETGSFKTGNGFGTGSSLAMSESKVFVQCDNDESSFVVAINKADGKEAWRKERDGRTSWATPLVWKNAKRTELVTLGSGFVTSYDPETGDTFWKASGMGMSFSSSPAADENQVYFGNSGPRSVGPLVAIGNDAEGEFAFDSSNISPKFAWAQMKSGPGMSSPLSVGGFVYVASRGIMSCYDASNGERAFKERIKLGSTAASMWGSDKYAFLIDETGKTAVIEVGDKLNVIGNNKLDDIFWSTPSVVGKSLLLRGAKKLYCIRE
ncbi:MAG: PQQ-binding-like beta-propeller repeat protein [Mariniblastus sp.]